MKKKYLSSKYLNTLKIFLNDKIPLPGKKMKSHGCDSDFSARIDDIITCNDWSSIILTTCHKLILWNDIFKYYKFSVLEDSVSKIDRINDVVITWDLDRIIRILRLSECDDLDDYPISLLSGPEFPIFKLSTDDMEYDHITALRMVWNYTYSLIEDDNGCC